MTTIADITARHVPVDSRPMRDGHRFRIRVCAFDRYDWPCDAHIAATEAARLAALLNPAQAVIESARRYVAHYGYPVHGIDAQLDAVGDALAAYDLAALTSTEPVP